MYESVNANVHNLIPLEVQVSEKVLSLKDFSLAETYPKLP